MTPDERDRLRHMLAVRRQMVLTLIREQRGLRAALREIAAQVESPGPRTEREVDAIREVAQAAIHPRGES